MIIKSSTKLGASLLASAVAASLILSGCGKKDSDKKETPAAPVVPAPGAGGDSPAAPADPPIAASAGAMAHLPVDCDLALHIDIAALMAHPAIAAHLAPAFDDAKAAGIKDKPSFGAFLTETGLDPAKDFKDFALCMVGLTVDGPAPHVVGIGSGNLKAGMIDALLKTSSKKDKFERFEIEGQPAARKGDGAVAQAADGSIVGGNNEALVTKMIGTPRGFDDAFGKLGAGTMRVLVPQKVITRALTAKKNPFSSMADKLSGDTSVVFDLGKGELVIRIRTIDEKTATEMGGVLKLIMSQIPGEEGTIEGMFAGLAKAADVSNDGSDLVVKMSMPAPAIDGAAKQLAAKIRSGIE